MSDDASFHIHTQSGDDLTVSRSGGRVYLRIDGADEAYYPPAVGDYQYVYLTTEEAGEVAAAIVKAAQG